MKRTTYALAGAATIAALAIPATASANVGSVACVDGHPQASMTEWRVGAVVPYQFTVDGAPAGSGSVTIVSSPQILVSTTVLTGDHDLSISLGGYSASARVSCGSPAPAVVPAQVTTAGVPIPVVAATPPRPVAKPKRTKQAKPRVTCAYLRRVGAGPRTYARRGWTYRCQAPTQVTPPTTPAVTG